MKRSISLIGQPAFLTDGRAGFLGASKAQCVDGRRPLLDPAAEHRDLRGGQLLAALLGRHAQIGVVALDPVDQLALVRLAGHDRHAAALELGEGPFLGVEPQPGLALLIVGAVAGEAIVREDRPDIAREVHRGCPAVGFYFARRIPAG